MSQSNTSPLSAALESVHLTMHAATVTLERLAQRLGCVALAAAREAGRVQALADCLPVLPDGGPLAGPLGLVEAADALANVRTACSVHTEALDLLAGQASENADRVVLIHDELLSILPGTRPAQPFDPVTNGQDHFGDDSGLAGLPGGFPEQQAERCERCRTELTPVAGGAVRCLCCYPITPLASDPPAVPVPVETPMEPTPPVIVPPLEPNPAPATPAAEEVQVAANSGVLEAPVAPLSRSDWGSESGAPEPDDAKDTDESWRDAIEGPPDEDESDDEASEEADDSKGTLEEAFVEVFGQPVSISDEARAKVLARFPDARIVERGNGQRTGVKYIVVTGQGRQSAHLSTRRSSEAGAWIDAANSLES